MTTERIKKIMSECGIINECAASWLRDGRCGFKKCKHCNAYWAIVESTQQAVTEAIDETLNEAANIAPDAVGHSDSKDVNSFYVNRQVILTLAEKLKVK